MKAKFLKQTGHEYSPTKRLLALMLEGLFFLGILPGALVFCSARLDHWFELPRLTPGLLNAIPGCGLIITGLGLAWWAVYVQFTVGRGTPVPVMATQQLITCRPYSYCRNPMALGAILVYAGVAALIGSISAGFLVLAGAIVLLVCIKLLEEREMELRFGSAYLEYRKRTPFIIPRLRHRA